MNYSNKTFRNILPALGMGLLLLASCSGKPDTPTQGKTEICIDESYRQLFDAEVEVFEADYQASDITPVYKPEGDVVNDLLTDSCRVVVMGRDLTKQEKDYFESKKITAISTKIGIDALAFITHKDCPVKELTYNEVKGIFSGKLNHWNQLSSAVKPGMPMDTAVTIVFDNERSCNVRMIKETLLEGAAFPANCFAQKTNREVIDYVSKNPNAIGIIGVNWISDAEDTVTKGFMKKVNVLAVSSKENPGDFYQPYQAYIYSGEYPFCRNMHIINAEGRTGLGTGFAAFVAGEKGQMIILKAGMVPATQPVRMVTITN